jgi:hypothetical protein
MRPLPRKTENGFLSVSEDNRLKKSSSNRGILSLALRFNHGPGGGTNNGDLLARSKTFPRTAERQLDAKGGGEQDVDFPCLDFLQIACGNFSAFRQFILRHFFAHSLPAHVCTENPNSLPFFLGNWHDILHRFLMPNMNDTYIVKSKLNLCFISEGVNSFQDETEGNLMAPVGTNCKSKFVNEIADTHIECFRNSHESEYAGSFLAAFQFTDINGMQIGFFGQFFLAQLSTLTVSANCFANYFLMSLGFGHAISGKQEGGKINTVHSPLFWACAFYRNTYKRRML